MLLLALITVSEATIGVFVKLTDEQIPIQTLTFYAMALAAAFLFSAQVVMTKQWPRFPMGNVKDTAVIGVLVAAQGVAFNLALSLVPIANAVIFWSIAPFFVFIFSAVFLDERVDRKYLLIFGVALTGIVVANPLDGGPVLGNLVALATGAIYAAMVTYLRHEGKTEAGNDIAWSLLVAALSLSPFVLFAGFGRVTATASHPNIGFEVPVMVWAAGLGVVSTGFAYFGISIVLRSINANVYSLVDIIVSPVIASTFGFLLFDELPGRGMVVGGVVLLGAGFWMTQAMASHQEAQAVHPAQSAARLSAGPPAAPAR